MKLVGSNKNAARGEGPSLLLAQLCCVLFFLLLMGEEALAAGRADLMVRLATEADSSYVGEGTYEAQAVVQSRSQAAFAGFPARFRLRLKNAGDLADSFLVTGPGSGLGFTVSYLDQAGVERAAAISAAGYRTETLAPGEGVELQVEVTLTLFTLGASYRVAVTAVPTGDPLAVDQVKTETVACGTTAAVKLSAPPDGAGLPAAVVNYPYTVTNTGNAGNSFSLSVAGSSGWQVLLFADDGAGGGIAGDGVRQPAENNRLSATGPLPPGESYGFFVAVTVPESAGDGARGEALVDAVGEGAAGADLTRTTALAAVISLAEGVRNLTRGGPFAASVDAVPGDLLQYRMAVTNSGSAPATGVGIGSEIPAGLALVPDSLLLSLVPEGDAGCPPSRCGSASASDGSIDAQMGEGAGDRTGGALAPGVTLYLFFKAQVQ